MRDRPRLLDLGPGWGRVWIRVVSHDRPERLPLQPEVERDLRLRKVAWASAQLVATAAVLGVGWALGELALALLRAWVRWAP